MFSAFGEKITQLECRTTFACCALRALIQFLNDKGIMTADDRQRLRGQISDDVRKKIGKH